MRMNAPIKIAFADLGHATKFLANNFIPLNIGFLASFTKKIFGKETDIYLFKSTKCLIDFIKRDKPDILALSNYLWNSDLSLYVARIYKDLCPSGITVMGGPNFPKNHEKRRLWLFKYNFVDFVIEDEGELAFTCLVKAVINNNFDISKSKRNLIKGCYFLNTDGLLMHSQQIFLEELDSTIPSPYLEGILDEFLLNDTEGFPLYPLFESTRGCPFSCTFCRNGDKRYSKIRSFSEDRFMEEILYVFNLLKKNNRAFPIIMITDQNFGLYKKDYSLALRLNRFKKLYNFPKDVLVDTGKGNVNNVLKTVEAFSDLKFSLTVQSLDEEVLQNIKRKNFPLKKFKSYRKALKRKGNPSYADIIIGLPGDSKEKHLLTISKLLRENIDTIIPFSFMMLAGTSAESDENRQKYSYGTKWRLIPGGFSKISGEEILESEEIVVSSNTMSFEDYLYLRRIHLWVISAFDNSIFKELRKLLLENNIDIIEFLQNVDNFTRLVECPEEIVEIAKEFSAKSQNECFDSRESLMNFYRKNYQLVLSDKLGENLLQKFKFLLYINIKQFVDLLIKVLFDLEKLQETKFVDSYRSVFKIMRIKGSCISRLINDNPITIEKPLRFTLDHDVNKWLSCETKKYREFRYDCEREYIAYCNEEAIKNFKNAMNQYGNTIEGKGRALYRLGDKGFLPTISLV